MEPWNLKAPELEVTSEVPFKKDLYNRKKSAETLTKLLGNSSAPLVLCIDGRYGDGKTTYLRMWREHLKSEGFPTVLFNAWENDFSDDPLISLIGELDIQLRELRPDGEASLEETLDGLKKIVARLAKRSIPILVRAAARKACVEDGLDEILSIAAEEVATDALRKYEEGKKNILAFKMKLASIAATLADPSHPGDSKRKPLVVMIDELDRCRPPFAIGVLEKIKHLFSVPNVMFVLAVDKNRLNNAISVVYGPEVHGEGYLRRFFDFEYRLTNLAGSSALKAFLAGIPQLEDFTKLRSPGQTFLDYELLPFMDAFELTLRERSVLQARINFVLLASGKDIRCWIEFLVILLTLQMKREEHFSDAFHGCLEPAPLLEELRSRVAGKAYLNTAAGARFELAVHYLAEKSVRNTFLEKFHQLGESEGSQGDARRSDMRMRAMHVFNNDYAILVPDTQRFLVGMRELIDVARAIDVERQEF